MANDKPSRTAATFANAYRVATSSAEANNQDMQVFATGKPEQPFIAEPANDRAKGVIARILAG
jgi:hypothetical protein